MLAVKSFWSFTFLGLARLSILFCSFHMSPPFLMVPWSAYTLPKNAIKLFITRDLEVRMDENCLMVGYSKSFDRRLRNQEFFHQEGIFFITDVTHSWASGGANCIIWRLCHSPIQYEICMSPWIFIQINNFFKLPAPGIKPLTLGMQDQRTIPSAMGDLISEDFNGASVVHRFLA